MSGPQAIELIGGPFDGHRFEGYACMVRTMAMNEPNRVAVYVLDTFSSVERCRYRFKDIRHSDDKLSWGDAIDD